MVWGMICIIFKYWERGRGDWIDATICTPLPPSTIWKVSCYKVLKFSRGLWGSADTPCTFILYCCLIFNMPIINLDAKQPDCCYLQLWSEQSHHSITMFVSIERNWCVREWETLFNATTESWWALTGEPWLVTWQYWNQPVCCHRW